ncbi:VIT1/CCC1 transporter family protein [Sporolactobacillus vineae]|uniref:VIT1/CCC1 transporter family protein n=1 Tax=Sporolactobacillus vineae TaxID=444463 RepID=UPI001EE68F5E|nr:VIT1/CCC1 transporter family protein [Sporolactobacillus vineae]
MSTLNHATRTVKLKQRLLLQLALFHYWQANLKIEHNRQTYQRIADTEQQLGSVLFSEEATEKRGRKFKFYVFLSNLLGFTFVTQLMMKAKERRIEHYLAASAQIPEGAGEQAAALLQQERELIASLKERRLDFVGAIILGMNDALVEITGSVAGFTLSMSNTKIIAVAGLITGVAASLSMAASEFMAERSEGNMKKATTAAIYTGASYLLTVILLVLPFFALPATEYMLALLFTVLIAVFVIFIFSFYMAVAKEISFRQRFWEMVIVSLGVAALTFFIGFIVKNYIGISA